MDQVHAACDNLFTEIDHLEKVVCDGVTDESLELTLSIAKRVRRASTVFIGALASRRDQTATAPEA